VPTADLVPEVVVRRAANRTHARTPWLDSKQSFSFGATNDPTNSHHGVLLVNNDDTVGPGTGFGTHPHQDMEIVTWVLTGSLVHQDSQGNSGVIHPGLAQRMSAGTGILHSEKNDSWRLLGGPAHSEPVRFVQMWVPPDERGIVPSYEQLEIEDALLSGRLVPVASGMAKHDGSSAISIRNRYAAFHVARMEPGQSIELPEAPFLHLFVAEGELSLEGAGQLGTGDAVRFTGDGGRRVSAAATSEVLVWEMHATLR
jgi:redox-sensitive bicupin YhaK (pirin superfamily)